jgi:hypothetical protein
VVFAAIRALPVMAVLMSFATAGLLLYMAEITEDYHQEKHKLIAEHIHGTLVGTVSQLQKISGDEIFNNAIVDNELRADYVPLYLKSIALAGLRDVPVMLADYKGRVLFDNGAPGMRPLLKSEKWQKAALDRGEEYVTWEADGLLIAEPVLVYGQTEAVLVAKLSQDHLRQLLYLLSLETDYALTDDNNTIVYIIVPEILPINTDISTAKPEGWYVVVANDF